MIDEDFYITDKKSRYVILGEIQFMKDFDNNFDGYIVDIDEVNNDIPMIIQQHTNPLNKNKHDMKAKYLDSVGDFMHIGNSVAVPQNDKSCKYYLAITEPSSNGIYSEYKILPLTDDIKFNVDSPVAMKCIIAHKGLYDEISYINDTNVFEDKDTRAAILQYNSNTSKLTLFDDLLVNDERYKIVKIDAHTFREYNQDFGVMQLVMVDTPFGEIKVNETDILKGIVLLARVKDKILNSISRELLCYHNKVKRGDYIDFTYDRDKQGTMVTEKYLINNKPTMGSGYDKSLMCLCESRMNILNNKGGIVNVGVYFENNRMRIDKVSDGEFAKFANSSFMILIQNNETTSLRCKAGKRLIIDGKPYEITGIDDNSKGLIYIGLNNSQFDPNDDDLEKGVANYKSQMAEIEGDIPPTPVGSISGEDELYKGYANKYYLQGAISGSVTWSIDCGYVEMSQDGTNCTLYFNTLKDVNKTFTLKATYSGTEFTKVIKTRNL